MATSTRTFSLEYQRITNHNTLILTQHYTREQHQFYHNILQAHFLLEQIRDTRFIPTPIIIPMVQIHTNECNPKNDIDSNHYIIQTQHEVAHLYEKNGRHLITIPQTRLTWLWQQYHLAIDTQHGLEPPTQSFETKIVYLYQRYKCQIPKNDPLKFVTIHCLRRHLILS